MERNHPNHRLTEGSVSRKMLTFALPIFFSNLFQQLYNAVDSLIVGNFIGRSALAAVSSSSSMILLLIGFINGVSLGAGVLIARYYGAEDEDNMERAIHTTVALGLCAGVVLTVVGVILTPQILQWIGTPSDVIANSILYFRIYFFGSSAVVLYNMGASILQSVGDSRSPMKYLLHCQCGSGFALCGGIPVGRGQRSPGHHPEPVPVRLPGLPQTHRHPGELSGDLAAGAV